MTWQARSHEAEHAGREALWTLEHELRDAIQELERRVDIGTPSDSIDAVLGQVLDRARKDQGAFNGADDVLLKLDIGMAALRRISRGMQSIQTEMRGALLTAAPDSQRTLEELISFADELAVRASQWQRQHLIYSALLTAQQAAEEATNAATALKTAAGDEGASRLEAAFEKFAKDERASAQSFRAWTIGLLAAVAVLGVVAVVVPYVFPEQAEISWQGVVYRVSVLSALAGLAAYLGRQSGHHRRAAAWAEAIAVQLRAFPAFIQPIQGGSVADEIYEAFGKRVMGSPPDFAGKSDDATNPTISALIDALVKQSRSTS